jgi:transposase
MDREYIGIDLHKSFFQACAVTKTGARLWEGRFPRTGEGLDRFIARGVGPHQAIAVEASGPTWAFVEAMTPTGATMCVVDPRKTKLKAGFAAKTDKLDARRLADALRRESVVSIYVPPPEIRALREVCRGRHQLVRLRTRLAQMIRALLLRCDAGEPPGTRLYATPALVWLAQVELAVDANRALRRLERLYRAVHDDAEAADGEVKQRARTDPIAVALDGLVGIGPVMALTLRAEIGDIDRFRRGPELASYAVRAARDGYGARRARLARNSIQISRSVARFGDDQSSRYDSRRGARGAEQPQRHGRTRTEIRCRADH